MPERDMTFADRLGANVREMRSICRLTQQELADRAGLSPSEVGEVERGRRVPRVDTLFRLAGALNVKPDKLFFYITWLPRVEGSGEFIIVTRMEWHREVMKRAAEVREGTKLVDAAALIREVRDDEELRCSGAEDDEPPA